MKRYESPMWIDDPEFVQSQTSVPYAWLGYGIK